MNLFVDCHVFDDGFQGTRTYLQGIYKAAIKIAPHIHFYFGSANIQILKTIFGEYPNVTYISYGTTNKFLRLLFVIPRIIKKHHIDYAHFQYIVPIIKCCKEIVTIHDVLFLDFPHYFPLKYRIQNGILFRLAARRADKLLTVSEYSRDSIVRHFKIDKQTIYITPNAIREIACKKQGSDQKIVGRYDLKNYILYVSRFEPRKNHVLLLKAFAELQLSQKGYKLVFVGRKDLVCPEYEQYFRDLPASVRERIVWLTVSDDELKTLYEQCALFVFPSLAEGFGIPPLEAVVHGAHVLCANVTAMKDFLFLGNKLFNPHDLSELKNKMTFFIDNRDLGRIKREQEYIRRTYSWHKIARAFLMNL